jgi:hypothetical protein
MSNSLVSLILIASVNGHADINLRGSQQVSHSSKTPVARYDWSRDESFLQEMTGFKPERTVDQVQQEIEKQLKNINGKKIEEEEARKAEEEKEEGEARNAENKEEEEEAPKADERNEEALEKKKRCSPLRSCGCKKSE